ncbi:hypothetical protein FUA23_09755 [Neolewinella aurantiaca]|uniref:Lipoprotein n=1 Tax=Neolewinella aurantiaca TaxID=2602767 RepID=A0A5C7FFT0_9BACT|nr:hypothetical protein [Neolewinella aurantiaca]TXF89723.1 hypothetical protein FUA23_09755 [Neolewinella aurantiaca]
MKKLLLLVSILSCLTVSCIDKEFPPLEELGGSVFLPDGPDLFTITNVEQVRTSGTLRRISLTFASIYNDLPLQQQENITGAVIITPRREVGIGLTRTSLVETDEYEIGQNICYSFFFITNNGNSRETVHCFDVE